MKTSWIVLLALGMGCGQAPEIKVASQDPKVPATASTSSPEAAPATADAPVSPSPSNAVPAPISTPEAPLGCGWSRLKLNGEPGGAFRTDFICTYDHGPHHGGNTIHRISFWNSTDGASTVGGEATATYTTRNVIESICELNLKINGILNYRFYDPVLDGDGNLLSYREIHYNGDPWEDTLSCVLSHEPAL